MRITGTKAVGALAAVLAGALAAGTLLAQPAPGAGPGAGHPIMRVLRGALGSVDLSQEQKDKVKALFEAAKPGLHQLRDQMTGDRAALKNALAAEKPDPATVGAALLRVEATKKAIKADLDKARKGLDAILTPEQRSKFDGYVQAHKDLRRARMGGGGQPGGN